MIIYNFGKPNAKVRLNKKFIPLSGWSRNRKDGPAFGSFIRRGLTDPAIRRRKSLQKRLRNCNKELRQVTEKKAYNDRRARAAAAARATTAPVQQSGGGDAW